MTNEISFNKYETKSPDYHYKQINKHDWTHFNAYVFARYHIELELLNLILKTREHEKCKILDVGCGRCDLYSVAKELCNLTNNDLVYNGIDHNPVMTELGKQKWKLENIQNGSFETAKLPFSEWVVASGVFTQRRCETEDEDLKKLFDDIDILYNTSTQIVSFNLLDPINNVHHDGFFYVHPGLVLDMLLEKYSNVVLRHNYSKDVYTVLIYKF